MSDARGTLSLPEVPLPDWSSPPGRAAEMLNDRQARYVARSAVNRTGAAAPAALAPLMDAALAALESRVGDIDTWTADRLGWGVAEMGERLTSEQVDAVALALEAMEAGRGFLVADVTGFGKGRIAAAVARGAVLAGRRLVFFTEKDNLFSDFWRDVRDIGSEEVLGRPFILNAGARIVDTRSSEGNAVFPPLRKAEVDAAVRDGAVPEGCRVVMVTYSQFRRRGPKAEWLERVADGAHLVFDEGHNQAGDSATRTLLAPAAERAASITYSTATAGRDLRNLSSYASVFPWLSGTGMGDSEELPRGLGLAVAEASVREACARGLVVRREHDLSNMRLNVVEDRERLGRNEAMAEALAPVLSGMARLGSWVYAIAEERNARNREAVSELPPGKRRAASEVWFSHNFGAKLNAIVGQFLVALKVDMTVARCVEDIRAGRKPVVVIESTMESLLREFNRPPDAPAGGDGDEEALEEIEDLAEEDAAGKEAAPDGGRVPTFGDALRLMAERMLRVSVRRGGPDGEREVIDLGDEDEELAAAKDRVVAMAALFPDLPLSPIDDIRERIEEEGRRAHAAGDAARPWRADEISARSARVREGRYEPMPARDRNVTVARFNNGEIDALVLTTAASTGLSLHDAAHLPVQAARRMYELRPPRNVIQRVQMWGRVFRRGQRTEPDFFVLSSGLDAETFDIAVQNRKVQALSASVAGDAASGAVVAARDYEDAAGNDIAHDILMEHPRLARDMAISLAVPREEGDRSLFWISKLLRRLWLLGKTDREFLYGALTSAYEERVRAGLARPGGEGRLEGAWGPVSRRLVERGDGSDNPLTSGDVYLTEICSAAFRDPIGTEELRHLVREAAAGFAEKVEGLPERLSAGRAEALLSVLHAPWRSVDKALRAEGVNPVKRMAETLTKLSWYAHHAKPGVGGVFPGEDGDPEKGVLVDMLPSEGAAARSPREWLLSYVLPGDEEVRVVTLDVMLRDPRFRIGTREDAAALRHEFDRCAPGTALVSRKLLDGSPLGTLAAARRLGGGRRVAFSDPAGNEREGVLLPKSLAPRVASVPGVASTARAAEAVLADGGRLLTSPDNPGEGVEIRPYDGGRALVTCPRRGKGAELFRHAPLAEAVGGWHDYGQRAEALVPRDIMGAVVAALAGKGALLSYAAEHRRAAMAVADPVSDDLPTPPRLA